MLNVGFKVLLVVTSHGVLGTTGKPTGYYLPEVSHPVAEFKKAGIEVDIASPRGGKAPMDPSSRDLSDPVNAWFLSDTVLSAKLMNTLRLDQVDPSHYQAIVFAGGHGTMWDFALDPAVSSVSARIYERGGVVAAVCHGPAALVNIRLSDGQYLITDKKVTGFSNAEEDAMGLTSVMPFLLEDELKSRGALFSSAPLWLAHTVVDGRLVSGQNPASAQGVGKAVVEILSSR
jgi:putative intracellular protease/amidase